MKTPGGRSKSGFTLVEIMIVVAIIGLLAAIAVPSFAKARQESMVTTMANDLRILLDAFNLYAMEYGGYPSDVEGISWAEGDSTPVSVADYLTGAKWSQPTVLGGKYFYYYWGFHQMHILVIDDINFGAAAYPLAPLSMWQQVDEKVDDGNLSTGRFIANTSRQMIYSLEDRPF